MQSVWRDAFRPEQILRTFTTTSDIDVNALVDIFPSRSDFDAMLEALPSTPLDSCLAVIDPLVPPPSQYRASRSTTSEYDSQGFSKYARIVHGLLVYLADDRQTARDHAWVLHHFLALAIYAEELKNLPSKESPVFSQSVSRSTLQGVLDKVQQLTAYLLSSTAEEQWHTAVTNSLLGQGPTSGLNGVGQLVVDLVGRARRNDSIRESRALHMILRQAFSTATKADAEQWMVVARRLEKQGERSGSIIIICRSRSISSSSYVPRNRLLHHPLRPRARPSRPVQERACSRHTRHTSIESKHGGAVATPQPGRFCPRPRVGRRFPSTAARRQSHQGLSAVDNVGRGS